MVLKCIKDKTWAVKDLCLEPFGRVPLGRAVRSHVAMSFLFR